MDKKRFEEIITFLHELRFKGKEPILRYDDNMLLDCATRIYNSGTITNLKTSFNYGTDQVANQKQVAGKSPALASQKQLDYLYKNNIDVNTEKLTKAEAFKLIAEHKAK